MALTSNLSVTSSVKGPRQCCLSIHSIVCVCSMQSDVALIVIKHYRQKSRFLNGLDLFFLIILDNTIVYFLHQGSTSGFGGFQAKWEDSGLPAVCRDVSLSNRRFAVLLFGY